MGLDEIVRLAHALTPVLMEAAKQTRLKVLDDIEREFQRLIGEDGSRTFGEAEVAAALARLRHPQQDKGSR
jgi:hypothetical protein